MRFKDAQGQVKYGDPILENQGADIAALARDGKLKVKVCEGSGLTCKPTEAEATVGTLLGPLEAKDVPIIYCIGLNYKAHSTSRHHYHFVFVVCADKKQSLKEAEDYQIVQRSS